MICVVVGARPNFMKMAPIIRQCLQRRLCRIFIHTGQHYDTVMSSIFFEELGMPQPDVYLGVGSGSHAEQTARVMVAFEKVCLEHQPQLVIVGGDVNSTLACALVAAKLCIPVAHVEAGLRSFDRSMPEEINRVLTDHLSDLLFTSEPSGNANLLKEGVSCQKIHLIGNCMIDSLRMNLDKALNKEPWVSFGLRPGEYGLVTLHRPAAVDHAETFEGMRQALLEVARDVPLLFPVHPRTRKHIDALGQDWNPVQLIPPLGYLEFLGLMSKARIVLTDSGGVQEETTALGVPCVTLRDNTERPVTIEVGTNRIAGTQPHSIVSAARNALLQNGNHHPVPDLWDGRAASRIMDIVEPWLATKRVS